MRPERYEGFTKNRIEVASPQSHRRRHSQDLNPSNLTEKPTLLNIITLPARVTGLVFDYPFSLSSRVIEA